MPDDASAITAVAETTAAPAQAVPAATPAVVADTPAKPAGEAAKPGAGPTIAEGGAGDPNAAKVEAKWREDWKGALAGKDADKAKWLNRYQSLESLVDAGWQVNNKLKSGALKATLPENASPEDIAAYRKSWDVPEKATDYGITPPEGSNEFDKKNLDAFLVKAHESNIPKAHVQNMANAYFELKKAEEQELYEAAVELTTNQRAEIRAEWGRDFKRNSDLGNADLVAVLGPEKSVALASLTLANGTKLGDHPDFVRYITGSALRSAEDGLLVTPESALQGKTVDQRIEEIRGLQYGSDADRKKFYSPEVQAEYDQLYDRKARASNRAA